MRFEIPPPLRSPRINAKKIRARSPIKTNNGPSPVFLLQTKKKKRFPSDPGTHKSTCTPVWRRGSVRESPNGRPYSQVFDLDFHPPVNSSGGRMWRRGGRNGIDLAIWRCANAPANYPQSPPFSDFMPIVCTHPAVSIVHAVSASTMCSFGAICNCTDLRLFFDF